jgi:hypothetical protein
MSDILIQFNEVSFDKVHPVWICPSEVSAITGEQENDDVTLIHMKNTEAFLVDGSPIQVIRKLDLDYN